MDVVSDVLKIASVSEDISSTAMRVQINNTISAHQEEFDAMTQLQNFFNLISGNQGSLLSQFRTNALFVKDNWATISSILHSKG